MKGDAKKLMRFMDGATGYPGISFICAANKGFVRTELYLGSGSEDRNKYLFDCINRNKMEVERKFGGPLTWDRLPDCKDSGISVRLDGVNVLNENDWEHMIAFHCETCAKLQEATLPYLEEAVRVYAQ